MAGYFNKDKDYSEAIANETDAGKREQLLAERQNKIDSMGLAGSVASNEAVSGWSGSYRPSGGSNGSWIGGGSNSSGGNVESGASGGGYSISGLYDAIERARLQAFDDARRENNRRLMAQKSAIEGQYTDNTTRAQVNARLTARGDEEKLAALGLNAGSAYAAPTSGYTETSRVAADNALKSDLNGLSAAKQVALAEAEGAAAAADTALSTQNAQAAADAALKLADISMRERTADRDYALKSASIGGYLNGAPTLEYRQYQAGLSLDTQEMTSKAAQNAFQNAMTRWKTYGYVLPADAAVLGVPTGTGTSDERYSAAALRLNQLKTAYQTSK